MISACDIGGVVTEILKNKDEHLGKHYGICGDYLTGDEIAQIYSEVTKEKAKYKNVSFEEFGNSGLPGAKINAKVFEFYQAVSGKKLHCEDLTKKIFPSIQDFRTWLEKSQFKASS